MRRTTLLWVMLVAAAWGAAAPAQDADRADVRTARIIDRYVEILTRRPVDGEVFRNLATRCDTAGRLDELDLRLGKVADDARPLLLRGHLARYRGDLPAARELYRKAVGRPHGEYLAPLMLGRTLDELGEWPEAEQAYRSALDTVSQAAVYGLDVTDEAAAICRALGRIALNAGRTDDARKYWNRLVELDPGNLLRREELARILVENGLYDDAVKTYETIITLSAAAPERRAAALRDIAGVEERAGRVDAAFAAYRRALAVTAPGNWLRQQVLDRILELARKSGRLNPLEAELVQQIRKTPDDVETWERLVRVRECLADRDGVTEAHRNLVRIRPEDLDLRRRAVRHLLDAGLHREAAGELREIVRRDPANVKHRFELAETLRLAGDDAAALVVWEGIATDFARDARAQLELGRALEDAARHDLARDAYTRAVAAAPDEVTYPLELGRFEMRRGRTDDAVKAWEGITRSSPNRAEAHAVLAAVFREAGMSERSASSYRRAAALAPDDATRWRELAAICLETGRPDEASAAWEKTAALSTSPEKRDEAWEQVISIEQSRDRLGELMRTWRDRHRRTPDDEQTVRRLGRILERMGEVDPPSGAVPLYERFLQDHPDHPWVMVNLARLYPEQGHPEKAVQLYERLIEIDRVNARRYLKELIAQLVDLDRRGDAIRAGERLVARHPLDPSAHVELARVYEALGLYAEASSAFARALDLRPDDYTLVTSLARTYEASGDVERLKELHLRVLRTTTSATAYAESTRRLIRFTYGTPEFADLERLLKLRLSRDRREFAYTQALAEFCLADERPGEVMALYREALEAVPSSSRGEVLDAMSRHAEAVGEIDEAIRHAEAMRQAEGVLPRDTLTRLAGLYLLAGRTDEARRTLKTWWETDAANPDVHRQVAELSLRHGDVEGAIEAYGRLLRLPTAQTGVEAEVARHAIRLKMGELSERINRLEDAAKLYYQILEEVPGMDGPGGVPGVRRPADTVFAAAGDVFGAQIDVGPLTPPLPPPTTPSGGPSYAEVRTKAIEGLVRVHMEGNRLEELIKRLEARAAGEPARQQYYDDLARVLQQAGETERMVKAIERARDRFPDSFGWRRDLARAYRQVGRLQDALREYRVACDMVPEVESRFRDEIVDIHLRLKQTAEVQVLVRRLVAAGERLHVIKEVTDKCSEMGKHELAAALLDEALKASGERGSELRLDVAAYLRRAGKTAEAYPHLKAYLDGTRLRLHAPLSASAVLAQRTSVFNRLWDQAGPDELTRLLTDLERRAAETPEDVSILSDLVLLQHRMGRTDARLDTLERLIRLTGDRGFVQTVLEGCRDVGKTAEARAFVQRMLVLANLQDARGAVAVAALETLPGLSPDDPLTRRLIRIVLDEKPEVPPQKEPISFASPIRERARLYVARFYWSHGWMREAAAEMRRVAADTREGIADVPLRLAWYLDGMGERAEALTFARRAADALGPETRLEAPLTPGQSRYRERRSDWDAIVRAFRDCGFSDVVRERFEKLLADHPDDPVRSYDLAVVHELTGNRRAALDVLTKLAAARPKDVQCKLALAEVLQGLGRHAEAIRELEQVITMVSPPENWLYEKLSEAYGRAGDRAGQLGLRERMAVIFREPHALADIARQYRDLNMNDRAVTVFKRYIRLQHGPGVLYGGAIAPVHEYAQFLRQSGRFEEAASLLERTLTTARLRGAPQDETDGLRYELTTCSQALGRLGELIRTQEDRLTVFPRDVVTLDYLASLWAAVGRKDRVIDVRRRVAELRPREVNNLNQLAQTLRQEHRLDEAVEVYRRMIDVDPQSAAAYLTPIAEMQYEKGDPAAAVATVEMHLSDRFAGGRTPAERLRSAAYLFGLMGLYDREEEAYRRIITEAPDRASDAYVSLIRRQLERGKVDEACETAERAFEQMKGEGRRHQVIEAVVPARLKEPEVLVRIGETLADAPVVRSDLDLAARIQLKLHDRFLQLARPDLAVGYLISSWRARHGERPLALTAAQELSLLGRSHEAEALLREALLYHPGDAVLSLELAREYLGTGRTDEADRVFADVLRRSPAFEDRLEIGRLLVRAGHWQKALPHLTAARRLKPDEAGVTVLEAEALLRLGRTADALGVWEDALVHSPDENVQLAAADFFVSVDALPRAENTLRDLLNRNPNSLEAYRRLGDVLVRQDKHPAAVELYQQALDLFEEKSTRDDFHRRLQRVHRETGGVDTAVTGSERAFLEADAEWGRLSLALGARLEAAGRVDEAIRVYRRLERLTRDATMRREARRRLTAIEGRTPKTSPASAGTMGGAE